MLEKSHPAEPGGALGSHAAFDISKCSQVAPQSVLNALRCIDLRLSLARAELRLLGSCLSDGAISEGDAIAWLHDEVAPLLNVLEAV
jgi:hypothetical protein